LRAALCGTARAQPVQRARRAGRQGARAHARAPRRAQDVLDEAALPARAEVGLPDDRIVFACSNQLYKYDPETFETWCAILRRVPASVLWLLRFPPYGEPRIRAEAAARGVDPGRIIFTDVAAKPVHIRRSGLADVFLDTPLCNAHTTGAAPPARRPLPPRPCLPGRACAAMQRGPREPSGWGASPRIIAESGVAPPRAWTSTAREAAPRSAPCERRQSVTAQCTGACPLSRRAPTLPARARAGCDVLWGGCPMVTLPLERMASRVAASLCYATGLGPEMVVASQQVRATACACACPCPACLAPPCRSHAQAGTAQRECAVVLPVLKCARCCAPPGGVHTGDPCVTTRDRPVSWGSRAARARAQEYEERAVELGLDHAKRESLRARLKAARLTCPLFDTVGWVADFERVLQRMWAIHCEGRGPRAFEVSAAGTGA